MNEIILGVLVAYAAHRYYTVGKWLHKNDVDNFNLSMFLLTGQYALYLSCIFYLYFN
jgi:hypothetical protein